MNDHERLYIDALIHEAADLLSETATQRCAGVTNALGRLRDDPEGDGIWLGRFVTMFLAERALDTEAGACAVLEALATRPMPRIEAGRIGDALKQAAHGAFAELVRMKTEEALERAASREGAAA